MLVQFSPRRLIGSDEAISCHCSLTDQQTDLLLQSIIELVHSPHDRLVNRVSRCGDAGLNVISHGLIVDPRCETLHGVRRLMPCLRDASKVRVMLHVIHWRDESRVSLREHGKGRHRIPTKDARTRYQHINKYIYGCPVLRREP